MSNDVNEEEKKESKKKWLLLLLLLLLLIFLVVAIIVFLRDDGEAEAVGEYSNQIQDENVSLNDSNENTTDTENTKDESEEIVSVESKTTFIQSTPATQTTVALSSAVSSFPNNQGGSSTPVDTTSPVITGVVDGTIYGIKVTPNTEDEDVGTVVLTKDGVETEYTFGNTIFEDGEYVLTVTDKSGNTTTIVFGIDTVAPVITGVEDGKTYNIEIVANAEEANLDKVILTKNGTEVEYTLGNTISEDGEYVLTVTDAAGNETTVTFTIDTTAPKLTLNGESKITIEAGIETYTEFYATVTDNVDATITDLKPAYINYSVNGKYVGKVDAVDTTKPGTYKVVYEYTDVAGNIGVDASRAEHAYVMRVVTVQDTIVPTATVTTSNNNGVTPTNQDVTATLVASEPIKDIEGWTKVDDITFTKVYSANEKVTLEIEDLAGNKAEVKFEVKRIDKVAPVVTVINPNKYEMERYTEYVEKGYSAYDEVDKDVTNRITIEYQFQEKGTNAWPFVDELDTSKLGTYKIIYKATDKAGNEARGTRTVKIVDTTAPIISIETIAEGVFDEEGNWLDAILGEKIVSNEPVKVINATMEAVNPVNGYAKEHRITWSLSYAMEHTIDSENITVIVEDEAGNQTTASKTIFFPIYDVLPTQTTLSFRRMAPAATEPVLETTVEEPVVTEPVLETTVEEPAATELVLETTVEEPVVTEPVIEPTVEEPVVTEPVIEPITENVVVE